MKKRKLHQGILFLLGLINFTPAFAQLDTTDYYSYHTQVEHVGKIYKIVVSDLSTDEYGPGTDLILYDSNNTLQFQDMVNIHTGEIVKRDIQEGRIKTLNTERIVEIIKDIFSEEELRLLKEQDEKLYIRAVVSKTGDILEMYYLFEHQYTLLRHIPPYKYIALEERMKKEIKNELFGYLRNNFEFIKHKRFRITFGDLEGVVKRQYW